MTPFPSASPHEGRVRVGPFAEFGANADNIRVTAVRPFYSETKLPDDSTVRDFLWPVGYSLRDQRHTAGRILLASWQRDTSCHNATNAPYSFWFVPFYTQGRTSAGRDYWGVLPFYGELPEFLGVSDVRFVLFPIYSTYRNSVARRTCILWPFYNRTDESKRDDEPTRHNVFPFYGTARKGDWRTRYILWPFWNQRESVGDTWEQGSGWMFFPFWGQSRTNFEKQQMLIPPFFSWGWRDNSLGRTERIRTPWPIFQYEEGPLISKRYVWPIWGRRTSQDFGQKTEENYSFVLWPFLGAETHTSTNHHMRSRWFAPFYYSQTREFQGVKENPLYGARLTDETLVRAVESGARLGKIHYHRVWPFYAYRATDDATALETLALWPQQYGGGVTRCWAPFWTLYTRHTRKDGRVDNDLLWGLARWGRGAENQRYFSIFGLIRRYKYEEATEWKFF